MTEPSFIAHARLEHDRWVRRRRLEVLLVLAAALVLIAMLVAGPGSELGGVCGEGGPCTSTSAP